MRKLTSIVILALGMASAFGVENVVVDSHSRNVLNTGAVNFAPSQLQINGVNVIPGGGTGTGSGVTSITLTLPDIFTSPLSFTDDGLANWSATIGYASQPAFTFFGNGTASTNTPTFMSLSTTRTALGISNVDNTSDANKPVSTAQATINTAMQGDITANTTDIGDLTASFSALRLDTVPAAAADVDIGGFHLLNVATPTSGTMGANKDYVDAVASAGPPHQQVVAATTANGALATAYENGDTLDGVTLATNDRILIKNQTTGSENGIYVVNASGAPTRAADADTGAEVSGIVFVSGGTANLNTQWGVSTAQPITLGTTSIAYTLTGSGGTTYTNGTGLALSGNQFSLATIADKRVLGNNSGGVSAPTAQPATTVGFNLLGLTNPSAVTFLKINADNTVTARSAANFRSDIGAGTVTDFSVTNNATDVLSLSVATSTSTPALTFNKASVTGASVYGTSATGNPTFMSASTARGALGGTTVGQNIFSLTNPGAITFLRINNDNTVSALLAPAFLTAIGGSPVDSTVSLGNTGTSASPAVWTAGASAAIETVDLTSVDRYVLLPLASGYAPGKRIVYTDPVTTTGIGRFFRPSGTNTLNGVADDVSHTADIRPFVGGHLGPYGQKSVEFENVAQTGWRLITTGNVLFMVQDPLDPTKNAIFSAVNQTPNVTGVVNIGQGTTVTVQPTDAGTDGFVKDINPISGGVTKVAPAPFQVVPNEDAIGTKGNTITETTHTVPNGKDTVRIAGQLTGPLTVQLQNAVTVRSGQDVRLIDAGGSVSSSHLVTVTTVGGTDTFGGDLTPSTSYQFDEPNGKRYFTSDGSTSYSVSTGKTSNQAYRVITPVSGVFTIVADPTANEQHARLKLQNGANSLAFTGAFDGMKVDLIIVQPTSGAAGTLSLPSVSGVGATGGGVITLSSTNGAKDTLKGRYNGFDAQYMWEQPVLNYTTIPVPTAPSGLATSGITASNITLTWTDNSANETGFGIERCSGSTSCTNFSPLNTVGAGVVTYNDTSVSSSTAYNYRVYAFNSGGNSSYSSSASGTTSAGGATADSWELHFNEGTGNSTAVATVGPDGALLYNTDWTTSTQSGTGAAFHGTTGMAAMSGVSATPTCTGTCVTSYTYKVLAFKTVNGLHNAFSGTGQSTGATQAATLDATHFNTISWSAVTGADYYVVYRTASGGTNPTGALPSTTSTSFVDNGVAPTTSIFPSFSATDMHNVISKTNVSYGGSQVISISFWVKGTFPTGSGTVKFIDGSNFFISHISGSPTKFSISFNGQNGSPLVGTVSNVPVADNAWHLVVVELDNSTTGNTTANIRVMFDGENLPGRTVTLGTQTRSGATAFFNSTVQLGSNGFAGDIDDVRIYQHALTNTEMTNLFTGNAQ